jgi:hypothetical protein
MSQGLGDVTLADSRRPIEQDMLFLFDKGTIAQIPYLLGIEFAVKGEVKPFDRLLLIKGGSLETEVELFGFPPFDLVLDQEIEEFHISQRGLLSLLEPKVQGLKKSSQMKGF